MSSQIQTDLEAGKLEALPSIVICAYYSVVLGVFGINQLLMFRYSGRSVRVEGRPEVKGAVNLCGNPSADRRIVSVPFHFLRQPH